MLFSIVFFYKYSYNIDAICIKIRRKNNMPKISVIIPVYNSEKYLKQCLNSVIGQTLKDIEIICVDDGSTDNSKEILREYAKKDKRIKIIEQENQYAGVARNNGMKIAQGEYIHFLDSDDWLKNKHVYKYLYKKIVEKNVDFLLFQNHCVDMKTGKTTPNIRALREGNIITNIKKDSNYFIYTAEAVPWNKLYSREFIINNDLKFDPIIAANDRSFYIKSILVADKILVLNDSFIYYRINNKDSLTGEIRFKNYDCHFQCYESIKKICENIEPDIKVQIINSSMKKFFYFYHKSYGKYKDEIYEKLHDYFQTMDTSLCEKEPKRWKWWNEYIAIKEGNIEEAKKEFERSQFEDNRKKSKNYITKIIERIKEKGIVSTFRYSIIFVVNKLKKKINNIRRG